MARYLCHDQPDLMDFEATVVDRRPGAVALDLSAFYPGGGGQPADRGRILWDGGEAAVSGISQEGGLMWHLLAAPGAETAVPERVRASVDADFRFMMRQLHTDLHIINALIFQRYENALVNGVQIGFDSTARSDFDLPDVNNNELRALEDEINQVIRQGLEVKSYYLPEAAVRSEPGLIRSRSVAPPPLDDGSVRVIEIVGLDRQACGGTHLDHTGQSRPIRILKVDNKGRHNRRIKLGLVDA